MSKDQPQATRTVAPPSIPPASPASLVSAGGFISDGLKTSLVRIRPELARYGSVEQLAHWLAMMQGCVITDSLNHVERGCGQFALRRSCRLRSRIPSTWHVRSKLNDPFGAPLPILLLCRCGARRRLLYLCPMMLLAASHSHGVALSSCRVTDDALRMADELRLSRHMVPFSVRLQKSSRRLRPPQGGCHR